MHESEVLNSWKEISNYIGRGVRTVQRWEKDFGLPVRRPCGHLRGSVFATKQDVDRWLKSRSARVAADSETRPTRPIPEWAEVHQASMKTFHRNATRLEAQCVSIRSRFDRLASTLERTKELREEMRSLCSGAKAIN